MSRLITYLVIAALIAACVALAAISLKPDLISSRGAPESYRLEYGARDGNAYGLDHGMTAADCVRALNANASGFQSLRCIDETAPSAL